MSNVKGVGHGQHRGHVPDAQPARGPGDVQQVNQPGKADGQFHGQGHLRGQAQGQVQDRNLTADLAKLNQQLSQPNATPNTARDAPPPEVAFRNQLQDPIAHNPKLANTDAELRGEGALYQRPVNELVPDLRKAQTLNEVRERFTNDYALLKPQLVDVPRMQPQEKAQRVFEFFSAYAARFVAVATQEAQKAHLEQHPVPRVIVQEQPAQFVRDAPVEKPSEEEHLRDGEGSEDQGQLEKLFDQAAARAGAREGKAARAAREQGDGAPGNLLRFPGSEPQRARVYDRAELRAETHAFAELLRDMHFEAMRDEGTGKNGLQLAYELLMSRSTPELEQRAENLEMTAEEFPPQAATDDLEAMPREQKPFGRSEALPRPKVKTDLGESRPELDNRVEHERTFGNPSLMRAIPVTFEALPAVVLPQVAEEQAPLMPEGLDASIRGRLTNLRLGPRMLWNVLHKFRREGADSAVEQSHWDKIVFAALAMLLLVVLLVIALVAL